jgi:integrase
LVEVILTRLLVQWIGKVSVKQVVARFPTLWIRGKQMTLEEVSSLLGHASIQTTHDTYVHLTAEDLRAALTKEGGHDVR